MAVDIVMPELGESVHEGTVSRWLKKEGEFVKEDEPVVEILTDKVNTELQAPTSGILSKIVVPEGESVQVFGTLGTIEEGGGNGAPKASAVEATAAVSTVEPTGSASAQPAEPAAAAPAQPAQPAQLPTTEPASAPAGESGERKWFTPVVRAMLKEHALTEADLGGIVGSGESGRITKKDVEGYLASGRKAMSAPASAPVAAPVGAPAAKPISPAVAGPEQELVPLVGMRKMIAEAMVRSSQVPTVATVTEVDVTSMVRFREINKESFQQTYGVKLTYTPFFIKALAETLMELPIANSQMTPDNQILMNRGVHIGVAVALGEKGDQGLIVPVIRDCHKKSLIEIAKDLEDIAKKARANKLGVADVQGGTFTLTNPGTYGALFGTPMINAPQAGILGTYAIKKTPVIVDDMIAIRSIMHLVLTYDHRIIDGMVAGKFLAGVRDRLQKFDFFK